MTPGSIAETLAARGSFGLDSLWEKLLSLLQSFRPADGWLSVTLLGLNLMVVVWSVERADWVDTPNLVGLVIIAMLTGLVLSRIRIWTVFLLPVGLAVGLLVVVWQLTSFQAEGMRLANATELWDRLHLWYVAAQAGTINIDRVPFAFALMVMTWLAGYLAGWVFFRYRNFWGVFILGGAGLLSNLTYLPDTASIDLSIYLLTALLLVGRVQSVRRRQQWAQQGFQYDSHLGLLAISDTILIGLAVLIVAFLLPLGRHWGPTHDAYEYMRSPMVRWEDDFNRLFAGLPARRPLPYRIWGDVIAFQGTINPTTTPVLQVNSPVPMYWKARTYGTYTPKGWVSNDTVLKPTDWKPSFSVPEPYEERFEVTYQVTPNYESKSLFAGGQILSVNADAVIETYDSPQYVVNLTRQIDPEGIHPKLALAVLNLQRTVRERGGGVANSTLAQGLPPGLELTDVTRDGGVVQQATLAETIPEQPDTLSLRTGGTNIKPGQTYEITSSVSLAGPNDLRISGTNYPIWAVEKYTQLPPTLPQRVRDLGAEITAGAVTPYDKAKAIEDYLKTYTYNLSIEPPPYNADGVDYFLFEQKEGYSEYFGSAMTVLLRTQGIPARLATGYTVGDQVPGEDIFIVNDSHSHAWVEAFFPHHGWIAFEPTPGAAIPIAAVPAPEEDKQFTGEFTGSQLLLGCDEDEDECLDEDGPVNPASGAGDQQLTLVQQLTRNLVWVLPILGVIILIGGFSSFFWRRYLVPSESPDVAFRHLAFLGALNSIGPAPHQTPYQYLDRLAQVFPEQRQQLSQIVNTYVRSNYGNKDLSAEERQGLVRAWLGLRLPMLFHMLRRRTGEQP